MSNSKLQPASNNSKNDHRSLLCLPDKLFKYYRYDSNLNAKRLSGEIYLASPLDFNDPCDCRRDVRNNIGDIKKSNDYDWIKGKVFELGFRRDLVAQYTKGLMDNDKDTVEELYQSQLEKLGVFCVTSSPCDPLMWGYYASNDGYCIEYDVSKIIKQMVIGYINALDYDLTNHLYKTKRYNEDPLNRCSNSKLMLVEQAQKLFNESDIKDIKNVYIGKQDDTSSVMNFIVNIYVKRFAGESVDYSENPNNLQPTLFFNENDEASKKKYFMKTSDWDHENEFRFIVSLGGRKVLKLGSSIIKSIYFGCDMRIEKMIEIAFFVLKQNEECKFYKVQRTKNCKLDAVTINTASLLGVLDNLYKDFGSKEFCC